MTGTADPLRPDYVREVAQIGTLGEILRPLSLWERLGNSTGARRLAILLLLASAWQAYAVWLGNPLMFPTLTDTARAFWVSMAEGVLPARALVSLKVLIGGYAAGILAAAVLTILAVSTRAGTDLLSTLTSMFNPLPAIALLPLALLWFGLGEGSIIFVLVHSVLWPMALNTHAGFLGVAETLRMAGRNCGLSGIGFVLRILVPAAFPSILTGLKVSWAFAWRTLIASELVFGVSSGSGGLGWFIFEHRNQLDTAAVFAGLATVIMIGLFVESFVFRAIELRTVTKWGMQR